MLKNQHTSPFISSPRSLHIELFPLHLQHKIPSFFRARIASKNIRYLELELFKQQLLGEGENIIYHTYQASLQKVRNYRIIFFGLCLMFLGISTFIFQHNLLFFTVIFGNLSSLAKGFLLITCMMLSFIAAWLGYSLCIAEEASGHIASKAKKKLFQIYSSKRIEAGLRLSCLRKNFKQYLSLRQRYQNFLHQIDEQKEQTVHLLYKIQNYASVEASYRELLFNQALLELNDKIECSLHTFEQEAVNF